MPFPTAEVGLGLGVISSIFGAKKKAKGWEQYINLMRELSGPGLRAQRAALAYILPRLGKGSRQLRAQYGKGAEEIGREGERSVRRARAYWGLRGEVGRARGEETGARLSTREALARHALGYGIAQEEYRSKLLGPLMQMADITPAMEMGKGILGKAEAAYGQYEDFASLLGQYVGWWQMKQLFGQKAST